MTTDQGSTLRTRRLGEATFFVVLIALLWTVDTLTKFSDMQTRGIPADSFRLITEQVTSAVVVLLLVPCVGWWLSFFPIQRDRIAVTIVGHVVGSALFATAHYFLIVGLRYLVFTIVGATYIFSDLWFRNLLVEYQKDIKIYLGIIAIVSAYRYYRRVTSGTPAATVAGDRIIVQTGKGEAIIRRDDIECLEAARNYVTVSTAERDYLVRNTLSKLEQQLAPGRIVRTHRSYLVNIDKIDEIRTTESGGREIRLQGGRTVPLSRGYRDSFKSLFNE